MMKKTKKPKKYLFVHINKTGGTSVRQRLGIQIYDKTLGMNMIHKTAPQFIKRVGLKKWNSMYTFAFVRNPWDKVVSHYFYRIKTNLIRNPDSFTFEKWVTRYYGQKAGRKYDKMFYPQLNWISYNDKVVVDFVGRFETIDEDFQTICKAIGVDKTLPHLNKSDRGPYQDYYSKKTRRIVGKWFRRDIKHFNYKF